MYFTTEDRKLRTLVHRVSGLFLGRCNIRWKLNDKVSSGTAVSMSRGPSTEHCVTSQARQVINLTTPRHPCCVRPDRYDRNHRRAALSIPNVTRRRCGKMSWSTVSKAADRSSRTRVATSPQSTACRISESTRSMAVSVEWYGRNSCF